MLNRYREILSLPGALRFTVAGLLARAPMSMVGISIILGVRALYDSYSLAGLIGAVQVVAFAIGSPFLARLVDRYGQAQVMFPAMAISATALVGVILGIVNVIPPLPLAILAAIMGATAGSIGALVRARWAYVIHNAGQLQVAYALEAALDELVFVLGPVAATLLAASVHPVAGLWISLVFAVFGTTAFLLQRSTQPPVTKEIGHHRRESVMRKPVMMILAGTFVFVGAMFGSIDLSVVAFADELQMPQVAGIVLATMSLGSLISAVIYGARVWKTSLPTLFFIGVLLLAMGVSTFIFAPTLLILGIVMFIAGLTIAPTLTNVNTIVQRVTPASRLTEGLTWMGTAMTLGVSLGSSLAGPMIDSRGHEGGFFLTLIFGWLMVAVALVGVRTLRRAVAHRATPLPEFGGPEADNGSELEPSFPPEHRSAQDDTDLADPPVHL